jgi:hypothetical protein
MIGLELGASVGRAVGAAVSTGTAGEPLKSDVLVATGSGGAAIGFEVPAVVTACVPVEAFCAVPESTGKAVPELLLLQPATSGANAKISARG